MDTVFRFCRSKDPWIASHQSWKFPLSQKFRVDNFECHAIIVTEKWLKTSNMKFFPSFFFILGLFYPNLMSIFIGCDRKTSIIGKNWFFRIREYQIRRQSFLEASCDGTRSAPSALHFVPRCLLSALSRRPKLRFGLEKLINYTLFAAWGNNAFQLISNWTSAVDLLLI